MPPAPEDLAGFTLMRPKIETSTVVGAHPGALDAAAEGAGSVIPGSVDGGGGPAHTDGVNSTFIW